MVVRDGNRDPASVPLTIEEGWEPSLDQPLPKMRCVAVVDHDKMERCGRWSVRGLSTCITHSGYDQFPSVRVYADTVVESARLRLMGMTDTALPYNDDTTPTDWQINLTLQSRLAVKL